MELGSNIKRQRAQHGLSQEDLAAAIYVSRQTISSWENDKTYPDVQSLLLLSNLFGVSIDDLVKGDVKVMEKVLDEDVRKLNALTAAMVAFLVLALVGMTAVDLAFDNMPAALATFAALWVPAMAASVALERLKKKHDLVTYREITAFCNGEDPERSQDVRRASRVHRALRVAGMVLAGVILGAVTAHCVKAGIDALSGVL
ncbi:MAG: helix-turn-helix transcriptional regulator [Eggerthellaceae bacterium]|nr:helix-turn-helix transcriptional regulator [Eggerthellaceae bacterium]